MTLVETAQLLGNFGELFGAIAVVATLFYLAYQIRQNTLAVRITNLRIRTDRNIEHSRFAVSTPGFMSVYRRGREDLNQLTDDERYLFGTYLYSMCWDFQEQYLLYVREGIADSFWVEGDPTVQFRSAGGRQWWEESRGVGLDPGYVAWVNERLREHDARSQAQ